MARERRQDAILRERQNTQVLVETGIDLTAAETAMRRRQASSRSRMSHRTNLRKRQQEVIEERARGPVMNRPSEETLAAAQEALSESQARRGEQRQAATDLGYNPDEFRQRETGAQRVRRVGESDTEYLERIAQDPANSLDMIDKLLGENKEIGAADVAAAIRKENSRRARRGEPALNESAQRDFVQRTVGPISDNFDFDEVDEEMMRADIAALSQSSSGRVAGEFDRIHNEMVRISGDDSLEPEEKQYAMRMLRTRLHDLARSSQLFDNSSQEWSHPITGKQVGEVFTHPEFGIIGQYNKDHEFEPVETGFSLKEISDIRSSARDAITSRKMSENPDVLYEPTPQEIDAEVDSIIDAYERIQRRAAQRQQQQPQQQSVAGTPAGDAGMEGMLQPPAGQSVEQSQEQARVQLPRATTREEAIELKRLAEEGRIPGFIVEDNGEDVIYAIDPKKFKGDN